MRASMCWRQDNGRGEPAQSRRPLRCSDEAGMRLLGTGTEDANERDQENKRAGAGSGDFPPELLLQCESNSQSDLIMSHRAFLDMTSGLHDLEPFHLANGL